MEKSKTYHKLGINVHLFPKRKHSADKHRHSPLFIGEEEDEKTNRYTKQTEAKKKQTNKTVIDEKKIKLGINLLKARLNRKIRPAIDIYTIFVI